jgi:methyltransferase family protein
VILWHVLEHLENPAETLVQVHKLLKPGGVLVIEVPNLSSFQSRLAGKHWFHLDIERHLYHFTPQGLRKLLETIHFNVMQVTTFSLEQGPFGAMQSFLNCLGLPQEAFYRILKREVSASFPEKLFHYVLAGLTVFPAILFALSEYLLARGAVIRLTGKKKPL